MTDDAGRDALVERLSGATIAALDLFSVYLGDRLGYYRALADGNSVTSAELAERTGTAERYAREWLEQQAVTGILDVAAEGDGASRRYRLPAGYAEVLADETSVNYLAPMAQIVVGTGGALPAVVAAFRSGGGVSFAAYGEDVREGTAAANRPLFDALLGQAWLPAIPDVHARLQNDPPARVADVGCGSGWSSIAIARAYPRACVDGLDLDAASIAAAREHAAAAGVGDRVAFHARDAGDPALAGTYDLAIAIECLHDMANPVGALRAMRSLIGEGGTALIVDELTPDVFLAPGDDRDRLQYGFSITHCLPVGMVEQPSAGTGTVMRAATLRAYAAEAGFQSVAVLPIEDESFRFYRLTG
jgi:2-polyprenyl-3-methyl-5-hydroxy-6-metoxy-1,4-benzoquinol methylase